MFASETKDGLRIGLKASERPYFANFMGNVRPYRLGQLVTTRSKMLNSLRRLDWSRILDESSSFDKEQHRCDGHRNRSSIVHVFIHETTKFQDGSASTYKRVLGQSVFTLAPEGTGKESFRVWEALEAGSIPIVQRGAEWTALGPDHPLIVVSDWDVQSLDVALEPLRRMYASSTDEIDRLQQRVALWWQRRKRELQMDMQWLLLGGKKVTFGRPLKEGARVVEYLGETNASAA